MTRRYGSTVAKALRCVTVRSPARHNAPTMTTGADALAHFQERPSSVASRDRECANCGDTERALACCSRCRGAWFCSTRCQRAYWPFHRSWCRRNDFADVVERTEPKFARWMRAHGKQAVLKDGAVDAREWLSFATERVSDFRLTFALCDARRADEVDRLERKVAKTEDFYGRSNPKPTPPSFDAEDMRKMRAAEAARALAARDETDDVAWLDIQVPPALGIELEKYKWRQNQSYVEVFVKLPRGVTREDVEVALETTRIAIRVRGETVMDGELAATIKAELSTWFIGESLFIFTMYMTR